MKTKLISNDTRSAILNTTWSLIAKHGRLDVGFTEIAAACDVSRQTLYLAFGSRAGLLTEMVRNKDLQSDHVARLTQLSQSADVTADLFVTYLQTWLDYLPIIYPVGILLDAASLTDEEAASAWGDRMKGALLAGLVRLLKRLAKENALAAGTKPDHAAETIWSLVHPTAWRQLVIECGWSAQEFRRSRLAIVRATVLR